VWGIAVAAAVVAGLVSWLAGELALNAFQPRLFKIQVLGGATFVQPTTQSQNAADFKNATLAYAILGGMTGLAMGLAGGLAGRSILRGVIAGLGAAAIGAVVGTFASVALLRYFHRGHVPDPNDMSSPILVNAGIWMAIGAVGGLALAIGMSCARRAPQAVLGACLAACLGAVLFQLLAATLFPESGYAEPIASSSTVRLLAKLLVTVLVAAGAVLAVQPHVQSPAAQA
jgi:hypothetical protein